MSYLAALIFVQSEGLVGTFPCYYLTHLTAQCSFPVTGQLYRCGAEVMECATPPPEGSKPLHVLYVWQTMVV